MTDWVDRVQEQWQRTHPGLDVEPAGVFLRILRISRLMQSLSDEVLAGHGLDRAGFEVLSVLVRAGEPVAPTRIAAELRITGAGMTKRLRQVEAAGLVRRRPHGRDGRSVLIEITDRGREVMIPALQAVQARESSWLAALPDADRAALEPALRSLLAVLEPPS